jgi:Zn-dependent protease with chaperone function
MNVEGRYFYPHSARFTAANVSRPEKRTLRFEAADGTMLGEFPLRQVRVTERLGNIPRRFRMPDGALFETADNDAADEMLRGTGRGSSLIDRIERSWRWVLVAIAVTLGATYGFIAYGIPALALALANATSPGVTVAMSQRTLQSLDGRVLHPSKLDAKTKTNALRVFDQLRHTDTKAGKYVLLFRSSPAIGPNAFALPDGEIVITDEIFPFIKSDAELEGVLAHEMSHADHRHGLQRIYQASLVPGAIAVATGDASQLGHLTTLVPGVLLQSAYSREFEQQADDDAAAALVADGKDPAALGQLLQRMDAKVCGKEGCGPGWLASHPATADRVNRLMSERKKPR